MGKKKQYYIVVNGHKLKVSIEQFGEFKEGQNVKLYFTTNTKFVFNIKLIE